MLQQLARILSSSTSAALGVQSLSSVPAALCIRAMGTVAGDALPHYRATVVGAGPAGVATVGALLDNKRTPVLWVDPAFNSGRLSEWTEVPSNTKIKLFRQYAEGIDSFSPFLHDALQPYEGMPADKGCSLACTKDMVVRLTNCIRAQCPDEVHLQQATVQRLSRDAGSSTWRIDDAATSDQVYLATGSHPSDCLGKADERTVSLDVALSPSKLQHRVAPDDTVGVVGSSHSAVLVLKNLLDLRNPPRKVVNAYRSPFKYAKEMDGWILYDNTGLKGVAAEWTREKLDEGHTYEEAGSLERVCTKGNDLSKVLKGCSKVIYATGFDRNQPPAIIVDEQPLEELQYDVSTGRIAEGLYGFGIAFPEKVTDPYGNEEFAVGLAKFIKYIPRAVRKHTAAVNTNLVA